ncbi:MAG TPA: Crp/Fnr family transcriptional regulator [Syntrophales bacterium]|nr:Crp/Fnr family transcriptional regulator [Syntrophales bacterium]
MNLKSFLSHLPLFQGLSDGELKTLSEIAVERPVKAGEMIFSDGERAAGLNIVAAGRVKIFKLSPNGKEQILHIMGPGEPFAEVPVFEGGNYPANAQAIEAGRVLFIPRDELLKAIRKNPALALGMLAVLSRRLREFASTIENLSLRGVPERLSAYLLYLSDLAGGVDEFDLDIKKGLIANLLGTTGESLSRILGKMTQAGIIRVDGKTITIIDRKSLADVAAARQALE